MAIQKKDQDERDARMSRIFGPQKNAPASLCRGILIKWVNPIPNQKVDEQL